MHRLSVRFRPGLELPMRTGGVLCRGARGGASDIDVTRITVARKSNVTAAQIKPVVRRMLPVLVIA